MSTTNERTAAAKAIKTQLKRVVSEYVQHVKTFESLDQMVETSEESRLAYFVDWLHKTRGNKVEVCPHGNTYFQGCQDCH